MPYLAIRTRTDIFKTQPTLTFWTKVKRLKERNLIFVNFLQKVKKENNPIIVKTTQNVSFKLFDRWKCSKQD